MSGENSDGKNFWDTFEHKRRRIKGELPDEKEDPDAADSRRRIKGELPNEKEDPDAADWQLTEDRLALLRSLAHGNWVEGANHVAAPWTFVCCYKAGWLERDRIGKMTVYRLAPDGAAILENP